MEEEEEEEEEGDILRLSSCCSSSVDRRRRRTTLVSAPCGLFLHFLLNLLLTSRRLAGLFELRECVDVMRRRRQEEQNKEEEGGQKTFARTRLSPPPQDCQRDDSEEEEEEEGHHEEGEEEDGDLYVRVAIEMEGGQGSGGVRRCTVAHLQQELAKFVEEVREDGKEESLLLARMHRLRSFTGREEQEGEKDEQEQEREGKSRPRVAAGTLVEFVVIDGEDRGRFVLRRGVVVEQEEQKLRVRIKGPDWNPAAEEEREVRHGDEDGGHKEMEIPEYAVKKVILPFSPPTAYSSLVSSLSPPSSGFNALSLSCSSRLSAPFPPLLLSPLSPLLLLLLSHLSSSSSLPSKFLNEAAALVIGSMAAKARSSPLLRSLAFLF
eukprot:127227-Hanusia_phi.AAC.2